MSVFIQKRINFYLDKPITKSLLAKTIKIMPLFLSDEYRKGQYLVITLKIFEVNI